MSVPKPSSLNDQPHLVSLVLQSKKALQHGEQVCSRAHGRYNSSAQQAIDVLALDAKVRWISDAILEQLKLAAGVAKCIEEKRGSLARRVQEWDTTRTKSTDALESILESLGRQVVPPDFHETSAGSSLFGSQHSDSESDDETALVQPQSPPRAVTQKSVNGSNASGLSLSPVSPSATIRRHGSIRRVRESEKGKRKSKTDAEELKRQAKADRSKWKTLRDFVDDRAIEEILETIENDRNRLEDTLNQTDDYASSLKRTVDSLQESLPLPPEVPILAKMQETLTAQDTIVTSMAEKLESLAVHYDQMAGALKDSEAGEVFGDEDLQIMNRDTEELPVIMAELDESDKQIGEAYETLTASRKSLQQDLEHLSRVLNDLDELGDIMAEMLLNQDAVEVECDESLASLNIHLETLDHLHQRYVLYQTAFNKLLLEIARRRHYKTSVEQFVQSMQDQLNSMVEGMW
ncbi:hypothetical protein CC2G_007333 [Coprinopsis cinerea AmutBmut pab1-1]|nr:hypothetical protein CC2G_007333 [Coprinopsis cinerea AmutBmut pab1-1]